MKRSSSTFDTEALSSSKRVRYVMACPRCEERFTDTKTLDRHILNKHTGNSTGQTSDRVPDSAHPTSEVERSSAVSTLNTSRSASHPTTVTTTRTNRNPSHSNADGPASTRSGSGSTTRFICHICGNSFGLRKHMNEHIRKIHGTEDYQQCDECGKTFSRENSLARHIREAHDGSIFECDKCNYSSKRKYKLDGHKLRERHWKHRLYSIQGRSPDTFYSRGGEFIGLMFTYKKYLLNVE